MDSQKKKLLEESYEKILNVGFCVIPYEDLSDIIAPNPMVFGTTKDEKIVSYEGVDALFKSQFEQMGDMVPAYERTQIALHISNEGNNAFIAEEVTLTITSPEEVNTIFMRISCVMEYMDSQWKLTHWHTSTPVDTENDHWHMEEWKREKEKLQKLVDEQTADLHTKNRELEIEAAIERVRARTMAMQHSDELIETSELMFEQIKNLGIELWSCGFSLWYDDDSYFMGYNPGPDGKMGETLKIPLTENIFFTTIREAKRRGDEFLVFESEGESLEQTYRYMDKLPVVGENMRGIVEAGYPLPTYQVTHCGFFSEGHLMFITQEPNPEAVDIFKRFTKVFDQTYTRFLDLQKAEAQAREAQIEAALERVRSKSLAMHHSSELSAVVDTLLQEFTQLEFTLTFCIINLIDGDDQSNTVWAANPETGKDAESYYMKFEDYEFHRAMWNAWKAQDKRFVYTLEGEEKKIYDEYLYSETEFRRFPKHVQEANKSLNLYVAGFTFFKYSGLQTVSENGITETELEILERFGKVFEQAYTRFLDLQKAEAQTREAEINLAVERVRAKALAMHKSEEIMEVVAKLKDEVMSLDIPDVIAATIFLKEGDDKVRMWDLSTLEKDKNGYQIPFDITFKLKKRDPHLYIKRVWENPENYFYEKQEEKDFKRIIAWLRENNKVQVADEVEVFINETQLQCLYHAVKKLNNGKLAIDILNEPTDEMETILTKMGAAFDLAYKRFEDLQKAEAQTREANIQLALERVRARTMAMQTSTELADTAAILFKQLSDLGIAPNRLFIIIFSEETGNLEAWGTAEDGKKISQTFKAKIAHTPVFQEMFKGLKSQKSSLIIDLKGKKLTAYIRFLSEQLQIPVTIGHAQKRRVQSVAYFAQGLIGMASPVPQPDETIRILERFAKVFEQTYTRFLDLKKAEAQTREAKIETALEKIRSRTMGMQSSDELQEVANLLFLEIHSLGIPSWSCGYNILSADNKVATNFMSNEGAIQKPFNLPLTLEPSLLEFYHFLQGEESFFTQELQGKAIESHYNFMKSLPELTPIFEGIEKAGIALPTYQINHLCKFTHGYLLFITYEQVPDAHDIFKRFTKVFDQTYTRFLDIKKAESQAREAQIGNALEKVRSRSLAMQSPDELVEVAQLLREEMGALGVEELETSSIFILDDSSGKTQCWFTIKDADNPVKSVSDRITINLQDTWVGRQMDEFYSSGQDITSVLTKGDHRIEWFRYVEQNSDLLEKSEFFEGTIPERVIHLCKFSNGFLGAASPGDISDESWDLMKRATGVFSFAYTRFRDLQKAEESARRSRQQASLDRVRADISSMRSADDLNRVTPLVWSELTTLGIPFIRCGVFIIHEEEKEVEVYLSKPDGTSLAVMHLPFGSSDLVNKTVDAWQQGSVYTQHWTKEEFLDWGRSMMEQNQVPDMKTYQGAVEAPESLHLQFIPFNQGMLYVGSTEPLNDEDISLSVSLAKAFSIAYARYEDFVKLEKAKKDIEDALSELKATQSQLVQQEKLASLGQLTAGIAHEIKNPLNFVNNFSEVSMELVEEAREEVKSTLPSPPGRGAGGISANINKFKFHLYF